MHEGNILGAGDLVIYKKDGRNDLAMVKSVERIRAFNNSVFSVEIYLLESGILRTISYVNGQQWKGEFEILMKDWCLTEGGKKFILRLKRKYG